jgi:hypothetical protein
MATMGRQPRDRLTGLADWLPARRSRSAPTVGKRVHGPGNGVESSISHSEASTAASPATAITVASATDLMRTAARARRAPIANSQARVKGE